MSASKWLSQNERKKEQKQARKEGIKNKRAINFFFQQNTNPTHQRRRNLLRIAQTTTIWGCTYVHHPSKTTLVPRSFNWKRRPNRTGRTDPTASRPPAKIPSLRWSSLSSSTPHRGPRRGEPRCAPHPASPREAWVWSSPETSPPSFVTHEISIGGGTGVRYSLCRPMRVRKFGSSNA